MLDYKINGDCPQLAVNQTKMKSTVQTLSILALLISKNLKNIAVKLGFQIIRLTNSIV